MPKLPSKYKKGEVPAGLETFYTVEKDGFMCAEFDDDVALATNPALASNNATLLREKQEVKTKYDALVTSTGEISTQLNELRSQVASGAQISTAELAIVTALKGVTGTPDEIKKQIEGYPVLQAQVAKFQSEKENEAIAQAMGWKPTVFNSLRNNPENSKDLKFSVEDVTTDGKVVKTAYVTSKDANGADVKQELSKFVEASETWSPFLPSLKADAQEQTGPRWLQQNKLGGDPPKGESALDEHIKTRNAAATSRPNGLMPPPAPVVALPAAQ